MKTYKVTEEQLNKIGEYITVYSCGCMGSPELNTEWIKEEILKVKKDE